MIEHITYFLVIHLHKKYAVLGMAIAPIITVIVMITFKFLSLSMYHKFQTKFCQIWENKSL